MILTRRKFTLGAASASLFLSASAQASDFAQKVGADYKSLRPGECMSMKEFVERTHPRGASIAASPEWQSLWKSLVEDAASLADGEYIVELRRALAWIDDGHTNILPFEFLGGPSEQLREGPFGQGLGIRVRTFDDGVYVTSASEDALGLLGRKIDRVGEIDVVELMRRIAAHMPGNDAWGHLWSYVVFSSPALLQGLGAIRQTIAPVRFFGTSPAGSVSQALKPMPLGSIELQRMERMALDREEWSEKAVSGNYARLIDNGLTIYVSIDDMLDVEGKTFKQLTLETLAIIEQAAGARRLIVDLRRNGGGNNYLGEILRKEIGRSRFNRFGRLYVLIAPQTFSAAQNLATRLERETRAIFVGEPTGGRPNHFGDPEFFQGEATGFTAMVSSVTWQDSYPGDERDWIMPDIMVPAKFEDWVSGRDRALETALTHQPESEPSLEDQIWFFRRASQTNTWKPFWRED